MSSKVDLYMFHTGFSSTEASNDERMLGKCPFCWLDDGCDKSDNFYYNLNSDGKLWKCHRCQKEGNQYTFIQELYNYCIEKDSQHDYLQVLADRKSLPRGRIKDAGVRFNLLNKTFVIPTYNDRGKMNALYKYLIESNTIMYSPGLEATLFNWYETTNDTIWLCEGHWDKIAGDCIVGDSNPITCIGVPGAGTFKSQWAGIFKDKHLVILFDNDDAGRKGTERILHKILPDSYHKPLSVKVIEWPESAIPGFDLRDLYKREGRGSLTWIENHLADYHPPEGVVVTTRGVEVIEEDMSIDTFDKLLDVFRKAYHVTQDMETCLLFALTSIFSVKIPGEQVWGRIIGPPGSGKTSIAKAISASEQVVARSTFTGLFSGWIDEKDDSDAGLIPIIAGKTLVVKDADSLLKQGNIEQIMSELRDFYDKSSSVQYRNKKKYEYSNISSTMLLCGTNVLRRADQSFLGERFLDIEMRVSGVDEELIKQKMMERSIQIAMNPELPDPENLVKAATKGFISNLMNRAVELAPDLEIQGSILKLGSLISKMRAKVDRDRNHELRFHPTPELPTRIIGQFVKLALCAPVVAGDQWRPAMGSLLRKVTTDIIDASSIRYKVAQFIFENQELHAAKATDIFGININTARRELEDLNLLGICDVYRKRTDANHMGTFFRLTPHVRAYMELLNGQEQ